MSNLGDHLRRRGVKPRPAVRAAPVWQGPCHDGPQGGVTYSLLSRFLVCRERYRCLVVEGLRPNDQFNHRLEFGNMWHLCEEHGADWEGALKEYAQNLARRYPTAQQQVLHWYMVCKTTFTIYLRWWQEHNDVRHRKVLMPETVFHTPYNLPSGRVVYLRGKRDSVDLIGTGKDQGVYAQENKTKGDLDTEQLRRQLTWDLQTMLYHIALLEQPSCDLPRARHYRHSDGKEYPVRGVRYNVIRRPLSGGRGSIKQNRGETETAFWDRLAGILEGAHGPAWGLTQGQHHFFHRWKVDILPEDVRRFKAQTLDPVLENLCHWWDETLVRMSICPATGNRITGSYTLDRYPPPPSHWRHPFGVWNALDEGGSTDLDEYLRTGNEAGLRRTDDLFPELKEQTCL